MIVSLILAMSLQSTEPVEAGCRLEAHGIEHRNPVPTSLTVDCPDDVVDAVYLQQLAEYAIGLIDLDIDRRSYPQIATSIWFEWHDDESWSAIPGQKVIDIVAQGSTRLVERGYRSQSCSYAVWPDGNGVPQIFEIYCLADGEYARGIVRFAERSMRAAIEGMRFLPVSVRYCFQDTSHTTMAVVGERSSSFAAEPDLPQLCE